MKKNIFITVCCLFACLLFSQSTNLRPVGEKKGGWHIVGTTAASHDTDHDAIVIKPAENFKKLKVTVRNVPLNITKMVVVYDTKEEETLESVMEIPKNGESAIVDIKSGTRNITRIDFWYDSAGFTKGKAEVTVFGRK